MQATRMVTSTHLDYRGNSVLFNSFTYLVFLPIVVGLYWVLPPVFRRTLLLIASYLFYMNWKPAYGLLILALTVVNYFLGIGIHKFANKRKLILQVGLIFNLGCLCFYKYANFLLDSAWQGATWLHTGLHLPMNLPATSPALDIILPLGISFFTFEFIHYIVDVYRGSAPVTNFRNFALFAAFFPSQIAGPIKRFQDFVQQMLTEPVFKPAYFQSGMFLIFLGLFKKIVLGDNLGRVVNSGFNHPETLGTMDAWIAVAGFTFQIFFDFSGYTDIGRGSALLFGYKVPENFNWPFLAANLTDFWRRWHISLSTWLRDYLFIPLGGSRVSPFRQQVNVMITMVLGGLWHGAAWHYVIWGAFHGTGLVLSKEWHNLVSHLPWLARFRPHAIWHFTGIAFTWFFLFMAGVIFRANDVPHALNMTKHMFTLAPSYAVTHQFLTSTLPITISLYLVFLLLCAWRDKVAKQGEHGSAAVKNLMTAAASWWQTSMPAQIAVYASIAIIILGFAPRQVAPFIYFQF